MMFWTPDEVGDENSVWWVTNFCVTHLFTGLENCKIEAFSDYRMMQKVTYESAPNLPSHWYIKSTSANPKVSSKNKNAA